MPAVLAYQMTQAGAPGLRADMASDAVAAANDAGFGGEAAAALALALHLRERRPAGVLPDEQGTSLFPGGTLRVKHAQAGEISE